MADKGKDSSFARSTKSLQDNVTRAAPAMAASYSLVGAIILFGAIGYALDRWRGTAPWFLLAGLVHQHRGDGAGARSLFDRCVSMASRACLAAECRRYTGMIQ